MVNRGRERIPVQALMFVGASNHLPEDDALNALFDRFLLRVHSGNVPSEELTQVLEAGWRLEQANPRSAGMSFNDVRNARKQVAQVSLEAVRPEYVALVHRIRHAGIRVSDRRAVKLQRVIAASAVLCGRLEARSSDLWVLRYIWDSDDQQEVLRALVNEVVSRDDGEQRHPLADGASTPDAEAIARDLEWLTGQAAMKESEADRAYLRDRLAILDGRVQWVRASAHREQLLGKVKGLWEVLGSAHAAINR
jgi:MoxR-like ATPase